ncbi:hypothetical protein SDC9_67674 [bioreactor metagenome]|uniref:Uncharacterized protein n=1 Tax=bioreactor metagenome TaxID=1076179 RepID=A0A644XYB7_9ZZZZ
MPCQNVHVAVAHVNGLRRRNAQLRKQGEHPGGVRLCGKPVPLAANRVKHVPEVMPHQRRAEIVRLVGENGQLHSRLPQSRQRLQQTGVGRGLVHFMGVVIVHKPADGLRHSLRRALSLRSKALRQLGDSVAHHMADFAARKGRPTVFPADVVGRVGQIVQRVQQRAVQIKNCRLKHHTSPFLLKS